MEHLLNPKAREIEISGIRKFSNLVAQHEDVISLTIGQPDFFTPHHVKAAAKKAIDENVTSYTPNAGYLELRQAVQLYMKKKADPAAVNAVAASSFDIGIIWDKAMPRSLTMPWEPLGSEVPSMLS